MVEGFFESVLRELGNIIGIENLQPDANESCLIKFREGIEVQIEPYEKDEFVFVCCIIGEVPPGRYRSDVFLEALKANGMDYPRYGTFAYSEDSKKLLLFELLPNKDLTGDRLADFLHPFIEKALLWQQMIEKGEVPTAQAMKVNPPGSMGIFELTK